MYNQDDNEIRNQAIKRAFSFIHGRIDILHQKFNLGFVLVLLGAIVVTYMIWQLAKQNNSLQNRIASIESTQIAAIQLNGEFPVTPAIEPTQPAVASTIDPVRADPWTGDPWANVRDCAPTVIKVMIYEGNLAGLDQFLRDAGTPDADTAQYNTYDREYEVWQNWVLRQTPNMPTQGRYITALWPEKRIDSLDEVPSGYQVEVYNRHGQLGWGNSGYNIPLTYPYRCQEDIVGQIEWTSTISLTQMATSVITYTQPEGDTSGFVSMFYVGRELTQDEIDHLNLNADKGIGTRWSGYGFIGGSSSSHGRFDLNEEGDLVWNAAEWLSERGVSTSPTQVVAQNVPLNHEIVVHTVEFWNGNEIRIVESQRIIVLGEDYLYASMLETEETPELPEKTNRFRSQWYLANK